MEDVIGLVKSTLGEIEKMLSTKAVVGEPVTVEGRTLIPLIAVGFGFGAGGGSGKSEEKAKGEGGRLGTGGGGGVRPIALVVIDRDGVRVEAIRGGLSSVIGDFVTEIPDIVDKASKNKGKEEKD
jgi:uncharacterized spore protein YtfJ